MSRLMAVDAAGDAVSDSPELRQLFHRLNNQLGVILAHAELLEAKALDDGSRARAAQVVASVLDAMSTTREIRDRVRVDSESHPSSQF
jgi:hypothetical protein